MTRRDFYSIDVLKIMMMLRVMLSVGPDGSLKIANEGATFVNGKCMKNRVMVKSMSIEKTSLCEHHVSILT